MVISCSNVGCPCAYAAVPRPMGALAKIRSLNSGRIINIDTKHNDEHLFKIDDWQRCPQHILTSLIALILVQKINMKLFALTFLQLALGGESLETARALRQLANKLCSPSCHR